ncbi:MAG: hypothetical protein ACLQED_15765 [Desulfobaccales bacterium]
MNYTNPREVKSPKVSISNLEPIIDKGEWRYSVALLDWEREPRVAMRWNGGTEEGRIHPGNPQSRGLPTWFVLSEDYDVAILSEALKQGLGGGDIDVDAAKEAVQEALSKRNASKMSSQEAADNAGLETTIIDIITRLKAEGKI